MIVKLLTEHHLEFLGVKGGCRGSSESTHVKMLLENSCTASIMIVTYPLPQCMTCYTEHSTKECYLRNNTAQQRHNLGVCLHIHNL